MSYILLILFVFLFASAICAGAGSRVNSEKSSGLSRMEKMVADTVLRQLSGKFAAGNHDVEYVYAFCLNGCVGMIKAWLSSEHRESTKHIAELTNRMIENTTHDFLRQIPNA